MTKKGGRPLQYGEHKIQTTVRMPQSVIDFLKAEYGKVQTAVDQLINDPAVIADRMDKPEIHSIVVDRSTLETVGFANATESLAPTGIEWTARKASDDEK